MEEEGTERKGKKGKTRSYTSEQKEKWRQKVKSELFFFFSEMQLSEAVCMQAGAPAKSDFGT